MLKDIFRSWFLQLVKRKHHEELVLDVIASKRSYLRTIAEKEVTTDMIHNITVQITMLHYVWITALKHITPLLITLQLYLMKCLIQRVHLLMMSNTLTYLQNIYRCWQALQGKYSVLVSRLSLFTTIIHFWDI